MNLKEEAFQPASNSEVVFSALGNRAASAVDADCHSWRPLQVPLGIVTAPVDGFSPTCALPPFF